MKVVQSEATKKSPQRLLSKGYLVVRRVWHKSFIEFVRFVKELKPTWFVLENVFGLTNINEGKTVTMIENCFKALDYEVSSKVLWASDYGVPQKRNRFFMVGNRHGIPLAHTPLLLPQVSRE